MAPIDSKVMPNYKSDLGFDYKNIGFKLKAGRANLGAGCGAYTDKTNSFCPSPNLFKPRAIICTFVDGERVRFPVSDPSLITSCIQVLKKNVNIVCMDLDGESWGVVPPTLGKYTPTNTAYLLPTGKRSDKVTGSYDYTSDVLGLVGDKYAIERDPEPISTALLGCLENKRDKDKCVLNAGVKARYVIVTANGQTQIDNGGGGTVVTPTTIIRKGKVSKTEDIINCITAAGNVGLCVGYKGESIRNVHLLVEAEDIGE